MQVELTDQTRYFFNSVQVSDYSSSPILEKKINVNGR